MKKIKSIAVLVIITVNMGFSQDQAKNIFGVSAGFIPATMDIYFDDPFDFWVDRELSPVYHFFYARQVRESFRIGGYVEYEKAKFSTQSEIGIYNFKRYNLGINWLGQYPKTALHLQLGGYFGYGFLKAESWDNLNGIDLGVIMGPAFELKRFGVAFHIQGGHAWYESDGSPSGVMLYSPKYMFKVYYKL